MNGSCKDCINLELLKDGCPISPKVYSCPVIQNILSSTRILTLKLELLETFRCNHHKQSKGAINEEG